MADIRDLHRRALGVAVETVNLVGEDHLFLPTPCSEWNLGQLLAHMTGQNHGFAAAARGQGLDLDVWRDQPVGDWPGEGHAATAAEVLAAFAEEGAPEREFWLPEITTQQPFPGATAISFHFVDSVAHAWDVAKSIGVGVEFDDELLAAALKVSMLVPEGPSREKPGASFRPRVAVAEGAPTLDALLGVLGRSPDWSA